MKKAVVLFLGIFLFSLQNITSASTSKTIPQPSHGVAVGDVTDDSAVVWSRAGRPGIMHVVATSKYGKESYETTKVKEGDDFTGQVKLKKLKSDTTYNYRVWFTEEIHSDKGSDVVYGKFKTAPGKRKKRAVKITWSGDFAGQNVCRDTQDGFPIFNAINSENSNLFIGLGDMIYADNTCEEVGRYGNAQVPGDFIQSADLPNFWAHWKYNREDEAFRSLLASTPYYGIWDDHEVVNDFGPLADTRDTAPYTAGENLMPMGLKAFLDYTPIERYSLTPERLYRKIRWGKHVELFFLDNRQYRDANLDADSRQKTMLGREQLHWLKKKIKRSNATWKVIVSSVPISIPTGFPQALGRDGWTNFDQNSEPTIEGIPQSDTGFERELLDILGTLRDQNANTLFITTDVHFAEVFRYTPFADTPDFKVHEVVIGPGNAGLFPNRAFDETLGTESLFFFGPESAGSVTSWEEAKKWFNYGLIEIDDEGDLVAHVKNIKGESEYSIGITAD